MLASSGSVLAGPNDIRDQLAASDIPRPEVTLSTGRTLRLDDQGYGNNRGGANRADRKLVFDSFWASYKPFESSLGAALAAKVQGRHVPGALAPLPQQPPGGAQRRQYPRGRLPHPGPGRERGAADAAPLFRAQAAHAEPAGPPLLRHLSAAGRQRPPLHPRRDAHRHAGGAASARPRIWPAAGPGHGGAVDGSLSRARARRRAPI